MKKFLATLLIVGNLFFMSAAHAEIETYTGAGRATMSEAETLEKVIERAKTYALREAREKAGVYIRSQSRLRDLELVEDEVITLTGGILKVVDTKTEKSLVNDVIQVLVTVTVTLDSDALQKEIDKFLAQNPNRKPESPSAEQPKPVEKVDTPPPPTEKIKPTAPVEKVDTPPPPVEKIEPTAPVENVAPPPMDDKAMANELLNLLNAERAKVGAKPLIVNETLTHAAQIRVEELSRKPSNTRPNGQEWSTVVPMPYRMDCWHDAFWEMGSPQQVVDWYMNSKTEKKRILGSRYNKIGIAYFYKEDSEHEHYWVVLTSSR